MSLPTAINDSQFLAGPMQRGWKFIKKVLRIQTGRSVNDLIALSEHSDPWYCGSKLDVKRANWFAAMWQRHFAGKSRRTHLREIHYFLASIGLSKPEDASAESDASGNQKYSLTDWDWKYLNEAARVARLLRLVEPHNFHDHRSPQPRELSWRITPSNLEEPFADTYVGLDWSLPSLPTLEFALSVPNWSIGTPSIFGYQRDEWTDRGFYLEVWCEKSTMDSVLQPICDQLGVQFIPSTGFQTMSNQIRLLERVHEVKKPCRIFYIHDYDDNGKHMPLTVARGIEYWQPTYAPDADIKLFDLALTREQIAEYNLPINGLGEFHKNKKGQRVPKPLTVELDALEALVPGELEKIVRGALEPYLDSSINARLRQAAAEAEQIVEEEWAAETETYERTLEALKQKVSEVIKPYEREAAKIRKQATDLNRRLARTLKPYEKPLAKLRSDVQLAAEQFDPELPERPMPGMREPEGEALFDSARVAPGTVQSYLDQIAIYKRHVARNDIPLAVKPRSPDRRR